MEPGRHVLLEEFMAPRSENWINFQPTGANDPRFFPSEWSYESFYENLDLVTPNFSFSELITSQLELPSFECPFNEIYPFVNDSSYIKNDKTPFPVHRDHEYRLSRLEDGEHHVNDLHNFEERNSSLSRDEKEQGTLDIPIFNVGLSENRKSNVKKVEGQPSKNLMAERRRRKRLNDRLSMLRSVVPKISKMDRTSILADTIDYMKELLEKIQKLQGKDTEEDSDQMNLAGNLKELNMNEVIVKNPTKFDVERKDKSTHIEILCAPRPGLLLSTVNTIETSGLDIQQCVISCFNDFSLQASCSEAVEHWAIISCEDLKQALSRNAGCGGRFL